MVLARPPCARLRGGDIIKQKRKSEGTARRGGDSRISATRRRDGGLITSTRYAYELVLILLASTTVEYEIRVMFIYTTTSWEYSYSTLPYYERSMNTTLASSSKYH